MKIQSLFLVSVLSVLVSCGGGGGSTTSGFTLYGSSSATASLVGALAAVYPGAPTMLKMKIYEVLVSTSTSCSNPVSICTHTGADALMDLVAGPTLCSGSPAAGTYPCMILKMSDTFTFKANATAAANVPGGVCVAGVDTQMDIYRNAEPDDGNWKDVNGTAIDATGTVATPGEDVVYIFASTNPAAITVATDDYQEVTLASAMVVPGQATFYTNFNDQFSVNGANCWIESPTMGFR